MDILMKVPNEWLSGSYHFFTYYGDVFSGSVALCPGYDDGFFIVQHSKIQELRSLKHGEHTVEKYRQLGREIKDAKVIKGTLPINTPLGVEATHEQHWRSGEQVWKKMFVFGAGASANCTFGDGVKKLKECSFQPPLGMDLFDEKYESILKSYPGAILSIPGFIDSNNDIEACVENEWRLIRDSHNPNITARHINIQYYLSDLFKQISAQVPIKHYRHNLYNLFCQKLYSKLGPNERVGIVSFNYDTILEHYLEQHFKFKYQKMWDYIDWDNRKALLFKPHGSCNWGWKFKREELANNSQATGAAALYTENTELYDIYYNYLGNINEMIFRHSWGMEMSMDVNNRGRQTINKNRIELFESNQSGYFPALLMPHKDKDEFLMPYNHHNALRTYLDHAEELYLIGWKGNEAVFNNLLKKNARNLRKIIIVNTDPESVKNNISSYFKLDKKEVEVVPSFEEFVRNKMDGIFEKNSTTTALNLN